MAEAASAPSSYLTGYSPDYFQRYSTAYTRLPVRDPNSGQRRDNPWGMLGKRWAEEFGLRDIWDELARLDDDGQSLTDILARLGGAAWQLTHMPLEAVVAAPTELNRLAGAVMKTPLAQDHFWDVFTSDKSWVEPFRQYATGGMTWEEQEGLYSRSAPGLYKPLTASDLMVVNYDERVRAGLPPWLSSLTTLGAVRVGSEDRGPFANGAYLPKNWDMYAADAGYQMEEAGIYRAQRATATLATELLIDPMNWAAAPISGVLAARKGFTLVNAANYAPGALTTGMIGTGADLSGLAEIHKVSKAVHHRPAGMGLWNQAGMLQALQGDKYLPMVQWLRDTTDPATIAKYLRESRMVNDSDEAYRLGQVISRLDTDEQVIHLFNAATYRNIESIRVVDEALADTVTLNNEFQSALGISEDVFDQAVLNFTGAGRIPDGHILSTSAQEFVQRALDANPTARQAWDAMRDPARQAELLDAADRQRQAMHAMNRLFGAQAPVSGAPLTRAAQEGVTGLGLIGFVPRAGRAERAIGRVEQGGSWLGRRTRVIRVDPGKVVRSRASILLMDSPGLVFNLHGLDATDKFNDIIRWVDGMIVSRAGQVTDLVRSQRFSRRLVQANPMRFTIEHDAELRGLHDRWMEATLLSDTPQEARAGIIDELQELIITRLGESVGLAPEAARLIARHGMDRGRRLAEALADAEKGYIAAVAEDGGVKYLQGAPTVEKQAANHIPLMDWDAIYRAMYAIARNEGAITDTGSIMSVAASRVAPYFPEAGKANRPLKYVGREQVPLVGRGYHFMVDVADAVNSLFKTSVLLRLGYPARNLAEGTASAMASGMGTLELARYLDFPGLISNALYNWRNIPSRMIDRTLVATGFRMSEDALLRYAEAWGEVHNLTQDRVNSLMALLANNQRRRDLAAIAADTSGRYTPEEIAAATDALMWITTQRNRLALAVDRDNAALAGPFRPRGSTHAAQHLYHADTGGVLVATAGFDTEGVLTLGQDLDRPMRLVENPHLAHAHVDQQWTQVPVTGRNEADRVAILQARAAAAGGGTLFQYVDAAGNVRRTDNAVTVVRRADWSQPVTVHRVTPATPGSPEVTQQRFGQPALSPQPGPRQYPAQPQLRYTQKAADDITWEPANARVGGEHVSNTGMVVRRDDTVPGPKWFVFDADGNQVTVGAFRTAREAKAAADAIAVQHPLAHWPTPASGQAAGVRPQAGDALWKKWAAEANKASDTYAAGLFEQAAEAEEKALSMMEQALGKSRSAFTQAEHNAAMRDAEDQVDALVGFLDFGWANAGVETYPGAGWQEVVSPAVPGTPERIHPGRVVMPINPSIPGALRAAGASSATHHIQMRDDPTSIWRPFDRRTLQPTTEIRVLDRATHPTEFPKVVSVDTWGAELDLRQQAGINHALSTYRDVDDALIDAARRGDHAAQDRLSEVMANHGVYRIVLPDSRASNWGAYQIVIHPRGVGERGFRDAITSEVEDAIETAARQRSSVGELGVEYGRAGEVRTVGGLTRRQVRRENRRPKEERGPDRLRHMHELVGEPLLPTTAIQTADVLRDGGIQALVEELTEASIRARRNMYTAQTLFQARVARTARRAKRRGIRPGANEFRMLGTYGKQYVESSLLDGSDGAMFGALASGHATYLMGYSQMASAAEVQNDVARSLLMPKMVNPEDPRYFDALANLLARQYRDQTGMLAGGPDNLDPMVRHLLGEGDRERLIEEGIDWALNTADGQQWIRTMGLQVMPGRTVAGEVAEAATRRAERAARSTPARTRAQRRNWEDLQWRGEDIGIPEVNVGDLVSVMAGFLDNYILPSPALTEALLRGNVTGDGLRAAWEAEPWELRPVSGLLSPTTAEARALLRRQREGMGYMESLNHQITAKMSKAMQAIGSGPETRMLRHPVFEAIGQADLRQRITYAEHSLGRSLSIDEVNELRTKSQRFALRKMEQTLYTLSGRSAVDEYLRFVAPFFPAWRNALTRWGRNLANNFGETSRLASKVSTVGDSLYLVDSNGSEVEWGEGNLNETYVVLPGIGGLLESAAGLEGARAAMRNTYIPLRSLDVLFQGDMMSPGSGPWVAWPAQRLLMGHPEWLDNFVVKFLADKVFPVGPVSAESASMEAVMHFLPTGVKRTIEAFTDSQAWAGEYDRNLRLLTSEVMSGDRPAYATEADLITDATRLTDWKMRIKVMSAFTFPVAQHQRGDVEFYAGVYRQLRDAYGNTQMADEQFQKLFPNQYILTLQSSKNQTGGASTSTAVQRQRSMRGLQEYAAMTGTTELLGFVENYDDEAFLSGESATGYSQEDFNPFALAWQRQNAPVGSRETFRYRRTPEESYRNAQVRTGYQEHDQAEMLIQQELLQRGLHPGSYEFGKELQERMSYVSDMIARKNPAWADEDGKRDENRLLRHEAFFKRVLSDPGLGFINRERSGHALVQSITRYLQVRDALRRDVYQRYMADGESRSTESKANFDLALQLAYVRYTLSMDSPAFRDWANRYFRNDVVTIDNADIGMEMAS